MSYLKCEGGKHLRQHSIDMQSSEFWTLGLAKLHIGVFPQKKEKKKLQIGDFSPNR